MGKKKEKGKEKGKTKRRLGTEGKL